MAIAANGTAQTGNASLGGSVSLSLSSFSTGALMLAWVESDSSLTPSLPSGWTNIASALVGGNGHRLCYRLKVAGDTTVALGGGGASNTSAVVCGFTGATVGTVSTLVSGTGSATTTDPGAVTLASGDVSILALSLAVGSSSFTWPSGWTTTVSNTTNQSLALATNTSPGTGSVDPTAITHSSSTNRAVYHLELSQQTVAISPSATAAGSCSATVTAPAKLTPTVTAAATVTSSLSVAADLFPAVTATATATGSAEVGPIPKWKAAFRKYKAGQGTATVVAIGDSLTEGYYGGANVRTLDGWPVRAGLNLSRIGDPSIHPGVYVPTNWATITQTGSGPLFLDPSGTDPWTRSGQVNNFIGQRGLGDKVAQLYYTGATLTTTAPSWATHALIHFSDDSTGSGSVWQALSNGVLVYQHVMDNTPNEQTVLVPLQGSGNTFALNLPGTQSGNGNPLFSGVVFQQRKNAPITPMYSTAGHNTLGGATSVSLTSITTGALMVALAAYDSSVTPATPSGWTSLGSQLVGTHGYRLCYRVKQAGDTTVTFSPGGTGSSDVALVALNGASIGQVVGPTTATASGTTIASPAMDATSPYSWSLLALGAGQSGDTVTFPSGWTQQASSSSNIVAALGTDQTMPSDLHLAPGNATVGATAAVDRIAWQVEITQATTPVTESFVQVIENGHGGYEANSYANPAGGNLAPLSTDTSFYWAEAAGRLKPDLVAIYLGYNDLAQGRTAAQFQTDLQTMVTQIDSKFGYQPDLLFIIYIYLGANTTGFSHATWDTFTAAMAAAAASYGTRAQFLKIEDYWPPSSGPDAFTTLEPGSSTVAVHPTPFGQRTAGDIIAATLASSFVQLAPSSTATSSHTAAVGTPVAISPAVTATGTATAATGIAQQITPTASAVGQATGTVVAAPAIAPATGGAGVATGGVTAPTVLTPATVAAGVVSGKVTAAALTAPASAAAGAVSGAVTAASQLSPATSGTGSASAGVSGIPQLAPSSAGLASPTVGLQVPGIVSIGCSTQASGQATTTVTVAPVVAPGAIAAAGSVNGLVTIPQPLTATAGAAGTASTAATAAALTSPAATAASTASGPVTAVSQVAAATTAAASTTGTATAPVLMQAPVLAVGTVQLTLTNPVAPTCITVATSSSLVVAGVPLPLPPLQVSATGQFGVLVFGGIPRTYTDPPTGVARVRVAPSGAATVRPAPAGVPVVRPAPTGEPIVHGN